MAYKCEKCDGKGEIAAFRGVMGGVCFKCNGTGKQANKPVAPSKKYVCKYEGFGLFTKSARTSTQALIKAVLHWKRYSNAPAFANIISADQITVEEQI